MTFPWNLFAPEVEPPRPDIAEATTRYNSIRMVEEAMTHAPANGVARAIATAAIRKWGGEGASRWADVLVAEIQHQRRQGVTR